MLHVLRRLVLSALCVGGAGLASAWMPPLIPELPKLPPPLEMPPALDGDRAGEDAASDSSESGSGAAHGATRPTRYARIVFRGVIGEDLFASGLAEALAAVERRKLQYVLIEFDTAGGSLTEMYEMLRVIDSYRGKFTLVAHVTRALSAGVPLMLACDQLYFDDVATFGAAVPYQVGPLGVTAVDAKIASAIGAEISARGARHGLGPEIGEAMAVMAKEVWVVTDADGRVSVHSSRPSGGSAPGRTVDQIDGAQTVLTLSAPRAVQLGIGHLWSQRTLIQPDWSDTGSFAQTLMDKAAERHRKKVADLADVEAWYAQVPTLIAAAEDRSRHIRASYYRINYRTGLYYPEEERRRRADHEEAITAWKVVRRGIEQIYTVMRRYEESDFRSDMIVDLRRMDKEAAVEIERLSRERNR